MFKCWIGPQGEDIRIPPQEWGILANIYPSEQATQKNGHIFTNFDMGIEIDGCDDGRSTQILVLYFRVGMSHY